MAPQGTLNAMYPKTQMSFRQLEAKLRLAYVNKERAAQLEERKLAREIGKRDKEVCVLQNFCQILQHDYILK